TLSSTLALADGTNTVNVVTGGTGTAGIGTVNAIPLLLFAQNVGGPAVRPTADNYVLAARSDSGFAWTATTASYNGTLDTFLTRSAAATLQLGAADVNGTPVNQTLR